MAHQANKPLFNKALTYFSEYFDNKDTVLLSNAIFIPGIGGSGKTSVVDKAVMEEGDWISGPTDS